MCLPWVSNFVLETGTFIVKFGFIAWPIFIAGILVLLLWPVFVAGISVLLPVCPVLLSVRPCSLPEKEIFFLLKV